MSTLLLCAFIWFWHFGDICVTDATGCNINCVLYLGQLWNLISVYADEVKEKKKNTPHILQFIANKLREGSKL